jgi:genome maintenance exonuclease 1
VTTILQAVPKPGLPFWYERMGKAWMVQVVLDLVRKGQRITRDVLEEAAQVQAAADAKARAAAKGNKIHELIAEFLRTGRAPTRDNEMYKSFVLWRKWFESRRLEPLDVETTVYDLDLEYAGTMDLRAKFEKRPVLLDWKSSPKPYPEHYLQVVAYRAAADKLGMPTDAGYVITIPKDPAAGDKVGVHQVPVGISMDDFMVVKQAWLVFRRLQGRPWEGK